MTAPEFKFSIDALLISINSDSMEMTYYFTNQSATQIREALRTKESANFEFWKALCKGISRGNFLEVKLWVAKKHLEFIPSLFVE